MARSSSPPDRRRAVLPEPRRESRPALPPPAPDALLEPRTFLLWATYDTTPTLVVELLAEGPTLVWVNRAGARLLGCAEQDLAGRPLTRLTRSPFVPRSSHLPDDARPVLDPVRVVEQHTEVQHTDGRSLPVRAVTTPVGGSVPPRWVLRLHDGRAETRVAQDLRASQERFRALADQAPVGIFSSERGLRLGYVNDRFCTLLGLAAERLLGTDWLGCLHPDDVETALSALDRVLQGVAAELPLRVVRPDGELRTVQARVVPVRDGRDTGFLGTLEDVTERLAAERLLAHQARHDPLTGLRNRRALLERTAEELAAGSPVALMLLDLDDFKTVNDTRGHDAGDALLGTVASRLLQAVRAEDVVARFGGDEFAVLCVGVADEDDARTVAGRLLDAVTGPLVAGGRWSVAGSLGVALSGPGATPEELLRDADAAMYQAKAAGKSTWALFDEQARSRARERQALLDDLRTALATDALRVVYQPLVAVDDGRLVGVEALARWDRPGHGPVPPEVFVGLAEQHGLVEVLGRAVLETACTQLLAWSAAHEQTAAWTVSVNVSALQLRAEGFVDSVAEVLVRTGLPGERLCLELTESAVLHDGAAALRGLAALRRLGVRVALDDFGTGYSSLAVLRSLPVDQLKIDRSFLADLEQSGEDAVVAAVVGLAGALGLEAVAEGVESGRQLAELRRLGCPLAQGYLFARPLPAAEVATLLGGAA